MAGKLSPSRPSDETRPRPDSCRDGPRPLGRKPGDRSMRIFICLLATLVFAPRHLVAQDLFVLAKVGQSSYGSLYLGILPGGGADNEWRSGPLVSAGIRVRKSESFAVDALLAYSIHRPRNGQWDNLFSSNPRNTLVDLTVLGRSSLRIVGPVHCSFLYGLGLSYQHKDGLGLPESGSNVPSSNALTGVVTLGAGLDVRAPSSVEFSIEGSLLCRQYITPAILFGVAYLL